MENQTRSAGKNPVARLPLRTFIRPSAKVVKEVCPAATFHARFEQTMTLNGTGFKRHTGVYPEVFQEMHVARLAWEAAKKVYQRRRFRRRLIAVLDNALLARS